MQRMRDERGAVAVMVAVLMIPLIGFAALAIDISALYSERQQLQTGADAGALAIAQDCGRGSCGDPTQTAQSFTMSNLNSGTATATVTAISSNEVTVQNSALRQHLFAPVLGNDSGTIRTRATVAWGAPTGGTAALPLAFSWCEWKAQTGGGMPSGTTERTIYLTKSSQVVNCTGPSNNVVPGGFGWLTADPDTCESTSTIDNVLLSDPGNSVPSSCSTADLTASHNRTVLLPVFDESFGTGSGATYTIYGYAAFTLTGYHFGGQNSWNGPCGGNDRCVRGYFTRLVDLSEAFTIGPGAPQLGGLIVRMSA